MPKKSKCSLYIALKSDEALRIHLSPMPKTIGFDDLSLIKSVHFEITYKAPKKG